MSRLIQLPGQAAPNTAQRIATELRKLHRPTDNSADPARDAERALADARRAEREAQQAAAQTFQSDVVPPQPRMSPNSAQGSSHNGQVVEAQPTGATSVDRIRQITAAKLDNAVLPYQH